MRIKEKRILKYEKRSQSDAASVPRKKTGEGGRQIVSEQSGRERAREGWLTAWSESVWLRPCQFLRGTVLDRSDAKHAPPPRPPFGRSRGCRSQTVGADCLTMCHPRDRTNLTGSERERGGPVLDRSDAEHALVGLILLQQLLQKPLRTIALQTCAAVRSYLRLTDSVYHPTQGLRVMKAREGSTSSPSAPPATSVSPTTDRASSVAISIST